MSDLRHLKPGDPLAFHSGNRLATGPSRLTVAAVSRFRLTDSRGRQWFRHNGRPAPGNPWPATARVFALEPDVEAAIARGELVRRLDLLHSRFDASKATTEQLERIVEAYAAVTPCA